MRHGSCQECKSPAPLSTLFDVGKQQLCKTCAENLLKSAGIDAKEVRPAVDPTICIWCRSDSGEVELARIAGIPSCGSCSLKLRHRPLPRWLSVSMASLFLLLIVSMVRASDYFKAEAAFVRAERFLEQKKHAEAAEQLGKVLQVSPECRKALLLKIKADVLSDNLESAFAGIQLARSKKFEGDLIKEINTLLSRVETAMKEMDAARPLIEQEKLAEALQLIGRARQHYPESQAISFAFYQVKAGVAFDQKDYDGFLAAAREQVRQFPESSAAAASVASALATKYATTGDDSFRKQAEQALGSARGLCRSDEDRKQYDEYRERIEFRLSSREIISKSEYDRRFRGKK